MCTLGPAVPPAHPLPSHPHPQELLLEFESEVQKREHGFRLHADSMSSTVLTHELKVTGLPGPLVVRPHGRRQGPA